MAKQAALGFVKRTLDRCHQFEDTGKSCFNEPLFKDMFLTASSQLSNVRLSDGMETESSKPYASPLPLEARTGASFMTFWNKCSNILSVSSILSGFSLIFYILR